MFTKLTLILIHLVYYAARTAVVENTVNSCSPSEFWCSDGSCIDINRVCDDIFDCFHGDDEKNCLTGSMNLTSNYPELHRYKRQSTFCRRDEWQCRDKSCISFDGKCDGLVDCPDGSDESFPLCRNTPCQSNLFRCTYGACVDGTAPCNGRPECADNSDELQARCRSEPLEANGRFNCDDGSTISSANLCDGTKECPDGSDETVKSCASKTCLPFLFQCAYGACVDQGSDCNNIRECADGSDESDELCNRTTTMSFTPRPGDSPGSCVLPSPPDHGKYTVTNAPNASPGQVLGFARIVVQCYSGYGLLDNAPIFCTSGDWSRPMPECIRFCKLKPHPSVNYYCLASDPNLIGGKRICDTEVPSNTIVTPECKTPNYYSGDFTLRTMRCIDGSWDYITTCEAECGRLTPQGDGLIINGTYAERGEVSWHAGIYSKSTNPYLQICGGSILTNNLIVSAAHCFWENSTLQRAELYAVAVGKIYRPWNNPRDFDAQKSDVLSIKIPSTFRGRDNNYQDDIALLVLKTSIVYQTNIRPICLNFHPDFLKTQLVYGAMGKVAGWGIVAVDGAPSPILKVVDLPYIPIETCQDIVPKVFIEYLTTDKMCAGYTDGTAVCKGDSGGGLVFPATGLSGVTRYYLRGVVSTAPKHMTACDAMTLSTFTNVAYHDTFIKINLD